MCFPPANAISALPVLPQSTRLQPRNKAKASTRLPNHQAHLLHDNHTVRVGNPQAINELLVSHALPVLGQGPAVQASLQGAQGLLEGLLEGAPHGHGLPHRLHLGAQLSLGPRELLKRKAGNLQARKSALVCELILVPEEYIADDPGNFSNAKQGICRSGCMSL